MNEVLYIVMELAVGGDLYTKIHKEYNSLTDAMKRRLMYQVCLAVEAVHNNKLIHRDIKPENVLLDEQMNVKLCDFGATCHLDDTHARSVKDGTFAYMSPEQLRGEMQSTSSDIWALGILLYEMYHAVEPFKGNNHQEVLKAIYSQSAQFSPAVPSEVVDLFSMCVKFDPASRATMPQILRHRLFDSVRGTV